MTKEQILNRIDIECRCLSVLKHKKNSTYFKTYETILNYFIYLSEEIIEDINNSNFQPYRQSFTSVINRLTKLIDNMTMKMNKYKQEGKYGR